jgi:signal transduction histidine kinase
MMGPIRSFAMLLMAVCADFAMAQNQESYTSITAVDSLPQTDGSVVTIRANLTLNGSPAYVQDSTGGAAIDGLSLKGFRIGDELLVTGHPYSPETGLILRNSDAHLLWHGSPMPALSVTADEAALGKFAALLIEVSGHLLSTEKINGETWLRLESGHQIFLARLNSDRGNSLFPHVENKSMIRLRGVCSLQSRDTRNKGGFAILLRSAEDVTILSGPPWWSAKHLSELGILLGAMVIAGHLTLVQMLKGRFRAIMAERARLGHELHDTLAQSFAGLSYQIQAARKISPETNPPLNQHLDLALDMVRHSHSEAHRSIMMLRPQSLADGTHLHSAIQASLDQSTAGCQLEVSFITRGSTARLPLMTTDTLYRIAQESIANALRHGRPSKLEVSLEYLPTSVCLRVMDDGVGFDVKKAQSRGFGMAGMRERVRALRGHFNVESEPGAGTRIQAEFHLRRAAGVRLFSGLSEWSAFYWERISRILRNKRLDTP